MTRLAFIILSFIIIFPPLAFGAVHLWAITVLDLSIAILCFVWLVNSINQGTLAYRPNALNIFFLTFILYAAFQLFFNITKFPHATAMAVKTTLIYFGLFFTVTNLISKKEDIEKLFFCITLIGFSVSLLGILQFVSKTSNIYWLRPVPSGAFFGTFISENNFACYASFTALITLGSIISGLYGGVKISPGATLKQALFIVSDKILNERTLFKIFAFVVISSSIFLSRSRSSMVFFTACALCFILFIFLRNRTRSAGWAIFFAILCAYLMVNWLGMAAVKARLSSIFSQDAYEGRMNLYTAGFYLFKDYPIFGVGLGAFAGIYRMYKFGMDVVFPTYLHNEPLQLLIETGAAGFLMITVSFFIGLTKPVLRLARSSSTYKYCIGLSILAALFYLGMHGFTDFGLRVNAISSLAIIILAIFCATANLEPSGHSLTVNMKKRTLLSLPQGRVRACLFFISTMVFACAVFFITKPLIAQVMTDRFASVSSFNTAVMLDPGNDELYYKYFRFALRKSGTHSNEEKEMAKIAGAAINKAIKLNPYKAFYVISKGQLEFQQGNFSEAFDLFRRSILLEPCHSRPYFIYAYALFKKAIDTGDTTRRKYLLNKGKAYYKIARSMTGHIYMRMVIGDKTSYEFIKEALQKEGITIQ